MDIARYSARSISKDAALEACKTFNALPKLSMAPVASFHSDYKQMKAVLENAANAIAYGGLGSSDVESVSKLLVDGIATFSCAEFCEYTELITYAFVANLLYMKRNELQKSIIDGSEVLQVMMEIPLVAYIHTISDLQPHLNANQYLKPHASYLLHELHVLALYQLLDSYQ
ncbi:hypothetical protein ACHAXR_001763 [Thalassiosira sp. AJA248-18]